MRSKQSKKWKREELEIVKRDYENGDLIKLLKELGCSIKALRHKAKKLNIKRNVYGKNNPNWKGDKVGYGGLHDYIRSHKTKPKLCGCCKEKPPFDLANISGNYTRDLNDWEWICRKCHMEKDKRLKRLKKENKKQKGKTYEERYDKKKIKKIKEKQSQFSKNLWKNKKRRLKMSKFMKGNKYAKKNKEE